MVVRKRQIEVIKYHLPDAADGYEATILESEGMFILENKVSTYIAYWPKKLRGTRTIKDRIVESDPASLLNRMVGDDVSRLQVTFCAGETRQKIRKAVEQSERDKAITPGLADYLYGDIKQLPITEYLDHFKCCMTRRLCTFCDIPLEKYAVFRMSEERRVLEEEIIPAFQKYLGGEV